MQANEMKYFRNFEIEIFETIVKDWDWDNILLSIDSQHKFAKINFLNKPQIISDFHSHLVNV